MNSYVLLGLTSIIFLLLLTILKRKFSLNTDLYLILAITVTYSLFAFYRLGSHELCTTYYQPTSVNEEIILELDDDIPYFNTIRAISSEGNNNNKDSYQIYYNDIEVYGSNNLSDYDYLLTLDSRDFIKYNTFYTSGEYRYIKLVFTDTDSIINELAFYNDDKLLDVSIYQSGNDLLFNPENLIDEQEIIPLESTYYDETFFDEIYHVRNALEIASGSRMYASVHPLLGTVMISLGIRIFGLDPLRFQVLRNPVLNPDDTADLPAGAKDVQEYLHQRICRYPAGQRLHAFHNRKDWNPGTILNLHHNPDVLLHVQLPQHQDKK